MSDNNGFIKLHRKILDWEWYSDTKTRTLFLHLLIMANWEDTRQKGVLVKRGEVLTTVKELSTNNQQTIQQTRSALERLKSTNEITIKSTPKFSIITIVNYNLYQANNKPNNTQITNEQQTNQQTTAAENNKPTLYNKELRSKEHKNDTHSAAHTTAELFDSVITAFNSVCVSLPPVKTIEYRHAGLIKQAINTLGDVTFSELFKRVEASDFLSGRAGGSGWQCSFEWILKPENLAKILAGRYDNKQAQPQQERIYNAEDLFT